jgi:cyclophilin family peptidyl-prolyl cis-trans isomerase/FKBP-type peptidyl-prolyl cis-trans isomerase
MKKTTLLLAFFAMTLFACQEQYPDLEDGIYAEFITNKGTFIVKLHHEQTPMTVANFVDLAEGKNSMVDEQYRDKPFYDGLVFHRVIKDFMIQGGDPMGTGSGGPGYRFPDEIVPELKHDKKGILSMANSGPATNGSQFFVTVRPTPHLDGGHAVFGEVVKGLDIVEAISVVPTAQGDRPVDPVVIEKLNIIRKGNVKLDSFEKQMENIEKERKDKEARISQVKEAKAAEFAALKEQATEFPSGLKMHFTRQGDGIQPQEGQRVMVNYEGYLTNGSLFDSSKLETAEEFEMVDLRRKQANQYNPMPTDYSMNAGLIAGFKEGMLKMKVGDEAVLFIPSHLGYGESGAGNLIPPNSDLIFVIEIVEAVN